MMRLNSLLKNCLFLALSILFFFLFAELFFRVFYPHSGYSITYAPWGWTHVPNSRVIYYQEEPKLNFDIRKRHYPIPIQYNSKGLREFEYDYKKPDNVFRILVLGDSWAEDMGSFFENLHVKWLEKKLNNMGRPYKFEVINGGHYAFDNAQEYMFYLKEGRRYSPDIVLLMFATDEASPEYATLDGNGELILHYKEFTFNQRLYRNIVSFIRRNTHFGSFVLDRVHKIKKLKKFLIKKGYKEKDVPIVKMPSLPKVKKASNPPKKKAPNPSKKKVPDPSKGKAAGFKDVDKVIWLSFKKDVEADGGTFIFLNCLSKFLSNKMRQFLIDNGILLLEIERKFLDEIGKVKDEELKIGTYNKLYESHRFRYRANERVADVILNFLLHHNLLPERL